MRSLGDLLMQLACRRFTICHLLAATKLMHPRRITCHDTSAESAVNPQQAWVRLQGRRKERLTGQEGLIAFGLKSQKVQQLIQQLPGATRCERYSCWGEENVPPKQRLVRPFALLCQRVCMLLALTDLRTLCILQVSNLC